jgi:hypothetical protein
MPREPVYEATSTTPANNSDVMERHVALWTDEGPEFCLTFCTRNTHRVQTHAVHESRTTMYLTREDVVRLRDVLSDHLNDDGGESRIETEFLILRQQIKRRLGENESR